MIDFRLAPYPLGVCAAVAMLAGCGGRAGNGVVPSNAIPNSFPYHKSFYYTGAAQDFKVPAGVRQVKVIARGAHGAHSVASPEAYGGRVDAVIPVTPGEHLATSAATLPERLAASMAAAVAALAPTADRTAMAAAGRPTCARAVTRFRIASWSPAALVAKVDWPAVPAAPAAPHVSEATEMPAIMARSALAVPAGAAVRAVTATSPVVAAAVAVFTAVVAVAPVVPPTAVMFPMAAEEAADRGTLSLAPQTCRCGKGGNSRRVTA